MESRTVATLALTDRRSNHSARSHPHSVRSHPFLTVVFIPLRFVIGLLQAFCKFCSGVTSGPLYFPKKYKYG
jgi:hypothetical protein